MRCAIVFVVALTLAAPAFGQADTPGAAGATLAELPEWPMGFALPAELGGKPPAKGPPKADILVWVPPEAKKIRCMMLIPNNSDSKVFGEHGAFRNVCVRREMAIVYMRNYDTGIEHRPGPPEKNNMQALLDFVAEQTKMAEFRHAPWVTFGKSSRGEFPFRMAWNYPQRTIASVTYHGETPTWPVPEWAKLNGETILSVNANGETEWGGTWFVHVRPSLLNYRAQKGWLSHQVVVKNVGHGDYVDTHGSAGWDKPVPPGVVSCRKVWDYLAMFVDKAVALRVPQDAYPTSGPLALKQVDEAGGYLIDPFAVEEIFRVPHLPLRQTDGLYVVGNTAEPPVAGFARFTPLRDFAVADGVPVEAYESGKSPRQWLITDSLKFAMKADPMTELGDLARLMPKPGDQVTIDGKTLVFAPIAPKHMGPNGGISLKGGLRPPNAKITLLAYTVIEFPQKTLVKVGAGYTPATRVQMVINGVPVKHKQVLEMAPGKYPVLVVLRMTANWDRIEPMLADATEAEVAMAQEMQLELEKRAAEEAKLRAAPLAPEKLIRKASDVPKEQRAGMFWVADKELADAWLALHMIAQQGQSSPAK